MEFEDEPMDINESVGEYFEEGEINSSDDDEKSVTMQEPADASSTFSRGVQDEPKAGFITGTNPFDEDEAQKKLERAKRFSIPVDSTKTFKEKLDDLYKDLRIDKENERHYRFNAIHVRGTQNMSTEDVLEYFSVYVPSHVEWINDISCNVVWRDDVQAGRALLNLSKKLLNLDKIHSNADPFEKDFKSDYNDCMDSDEGVDARQVKTAIPPGYWRIGIPCKKSSTLLLRYATRSDKKQRNAERSSEYYKKYGNPNFGNIPGLISSSLRKKYRIAGPDSIFPREDYKIEETGKKNPWEELAYKWGKSDKIENVDTFIQDNIKDRLSSVDLRISLTNIKERHKRIRMNSETSQDLSEDEAWERKRKIPRMKMYADDEEKKLGKALEKKQRSHVLQRQPEEDLRSKINRKKTGIRLKLQSEKVIQISSSRESSNSENDYNDGDSGDWALEHYQDMRESLEHRKRQDYKKFSAMKYESDSDDKDSVYKKELSRRSPLQIEIENDEYYLNKRK